MPSVVVAFALFFIIQVVLVVVMMLLWSPLVVLMVHHCLRGGLGRAATLVLFPLAFSRCSPFLGYRGVEGANAMEVKMVGPFFAVERLYR